MSASFPLTNGLPCDSPKPSGEKAASAAPILLIVTIAPQSDVERPGSTHFCRSDRRLRNRRFQGTTDIHPVKVAGKSSATADIGAA